tara:strand:+ start:615 stop:1544 length:930 start_codon:yes stop_codon:yes gene_type:complete
MNPEVPDYQKSKVRKRPVNLKKLARRRMILRILAGLIPPIFGGIYAKLEAGWLDLSKTSLPFRGIKKAESLKLLHISDLHLSQSFSSKQIESALLKGFSESPDACFITGDFISGIPSKNDLEELSKVLLKFSSKIPTYACLGNHDGGLWSSSNGGPKNSNQIRNMLRKARVRLLVNERISLRIKGIPLQLVGVGDLWSKECFPRLCMTHRSQRPPKEAVILMCHNPDAKEMLKSYFWNLMLAGHTHGGQFVIPFTKFAPFAPVVDQSMVEGLHQWDKWRHIHITRGVGNLYGIRFNCRPEVNLLELVAK